MEKAANPLAQVLTKLRAHPWRTAGGVGATAAGGAGLLATLGRAAPSAAASQRIETLNADSANTLANLLRMSLAAVGAGVAARSAVGLRANLNRSLRAAPSPPASPQVITLTVPSRAVDAPPEKRADLQSISRRALDAVGATLTPGQPPTLAQSRFWGAHLSGAMNKPYAWPTAALGMMAGLYGGYKLTDKILDALRKREQSAELQTAKDDYERALQEVAQGGPLKTAHDVWQASRQKAAALPVSLNSLLGLYGLALTGFTAAGASLGYRAARKSSRTRALEDALRLRRAELAAAQPLPLVATTKEANSAQTLADAVNRLTAQRAQARAQALQQLSGEKPKQSATAPATQPPAPQLPSVLPAAPQPQVAA